MPLNSFLLMACVSKVSLVELLEINIPCECCSVSWNPWTRIQLSVSSIPFSLEASVAYFVDWRFEDLSAAFYTLPVLQSGTHCSLQLGVHYTLQIWVTRS